MVRVGLENWVDVAKWITIKNFSRAPNFNIYSSSEIIVVDDMHHFQHYLISALFRLSHRAVKTL